jgi:hypothetical protein
MRSDYNISSSSNRSLVGASWATVMIILDPIGVGWVPLLYFCLLYRQMITMINRPLILGPVSVANVANKRSIFSQVSTLQFLVGILTIFLINLISSQQMNSILKEFNQLASLFGLPPPSCCRYRNLFQSTGFIAKFILPPTRSGFKMSSTRSSSRNRKE